MKLIKNLLLTILFFCSTTTVFSQELRDANNDLIAKIDSSGNVYDLKNLKIVEFTLEGDILDVNNQKIGTINGNNFKDVQGGIICYINESNQLFDSDNQMIGYVSSNLKELFDVNDMKVLSSLTPINPKRLIAFYLFFIML